jgi:hypothetical protein
MAEEFDLSSLQKEMGVTPKDKQKISRRIYYGGLILIIPGA